MKRAAAVTACVCAAVALAVAGLWALGSSAIRNAPAPTYQGDKVGIEQGETLDEYRQRARESLRDATGPTWALVTFAAPLDPGDAAQGVAPVARVSAVVFLEEAPRAVPEPVAGEGRAEVFAREAGRSAAETGEAPQGVAGVLVRDEAEVLREVAGDPRVVAVEALPADARWGAFAIAPVPAAAPR